MENILEKKLDQIAGQKKNQEEQVLSDMKLLLENTAIEEREVLKKIGLSRQIETEEGIREDELIRTKNAEHFERKIYHVTEINKLCQAYRLVMKKPKLYKGTIPATLGSELRRFCEEKNIPLGYSSDLNNFYLIAPPAMFDGYVSPGDIIRQHGMDALRKLRPVRQSDPLLLYQVDPNYYAAVKAWGNDFSLKRRVLGFLYKRSTLKVTVFFTLLTLLGGLFATAWYSTMALHNWGIAIGEKGECHPGGITLFTLVDGACLVGALISITIYSASKKKIINDLATPEIKAKD